MYSTFAAIMEKISVKPFTWDSFNFPKSIFLVSTFLPSFEILHRDFDAVLFPAFFARQAKPRLICSIYEDINGFSD